VSIQSWPTFYLYFFNTAPGTAATTTKILKFIENILSVDFVFGILV
jgi:hypothetical protein